MFQSEYDKKQFSFILAKEEPGENVSEELKEFLKGKKAFFFSALDFGKQKNINRLWNEMTQYFGETSKEVASADGIFNYIAQKAQNERVIWVLENAEDLISEDEIKTIEPLLSKLKETNNMIIVVSKSVAFQAKLQESKLKKLITSVHSSTNKNFFALKADDGLNPEERFKYFAIFGTEKEYRNKLNNSKELKENVVSTFFDRSGAFYMEPKRILKEELRETQVYNLVLEAISKGCTTLNEISEYLAMPTSICNKYTTVLVSLGIIDKVKPTFGKESRKSKYKIANNVMDFWYAFVPQNASKISLSRGEEVFDTISAKQLSKYFQTKFAGVCKEYIDKLNGEGKINIDVKENGTWWDKDTTIDIVAGSGLDAIAADCFWDDELIGKDKLEQLEKKAEKLDVIDRQYYLFAKNGFSEELKDLAETREDIKLFTFDEMCGTARKEEKGKRKGFFFSRR